MQKQNMSFPLDEGEHLNRSPNQPVLEIVEGEAPEDTYLWIGNNDDMDKACFASLLGVDKLRRLARAILQAIGDTDAP
jgi:hypothetical protein